MWQVTQRFLSYHRNKTSIAKKLANCRLIQSLVKLLLALSHSGGSLVRFVSQKKCLMLKKDSAYSEKRRQLNIHLSHSVSLLIVDIS